MTEAADDVMRREMRVLIACEFSGVVRRAFAARGHDAWSCDLLPALDGSNKHIVGDARDLLDDGWDLLIVAHPPCTRLCNSGVRWLSVPPAGKTKEQMWSDLATGAALFSAFWNAPIERICVENPVMHRHAKERIENYAEPAQSVQPWQFGHGEIKRTCFWLRNLPPLRPTSIVDGRTPRVHFASPGPDRWKERSRFFPGILNFAAKWPEDQRAKLNTAKLSGATIAFWRSSDKGLPSNGGGKIEPADPGVIHTAPGPLQLCERGTLHATLLPPKWEGSRWWIVALHGEVIGDEDKYGCLQREILGEAL